MPTTLASVRQAGQVLRGNVCGLIGLLGLTRLLPQISPVLGTSQINTHTLLESLATGQTQKHTLTSTSGPALWSLLAMPVLATGTEGRL